MRLRKLWTTVRDSLWFVPALWVIASTALAFTMIAIDRTSPDFAARYPLIFGGGAEGARGILSSIASSMITVAGVTFSITIVALQLASSQFAPRVLRTFMRDRASQVVLGSFIGAFTYAILVLRSVRADTAGSPAFIPSIAVSVAIVFALVALGMLVYFLHHIATRIQISTIVASVAEESVAQIEVDWPEEPDGGPDDLPEEAPGIITAAESGNLQLLDVERLTEIATRFQLRIVLSVIPGDWVQEDAPLFEVWPAAADEQLAEQLRDQVSVGSQRSIEQDAAFGIRQLVDVAVKAISPGINDPTSATDCIDRLTQIVTAAGRRHPPHQVRRDDEGIVRLIVPYRSWDDLVALAYDQIRQYSAGSADISIAILSSLRTVALATSRSRHDALHRQARLVSETAHRVEPEPDRRRVLEAVDRVLRT